MGLSCTTPFLHRDVVKLLPAGGRVPLHHQTVLRAVSCSFAGCNELSHAPQERSVELEGSPVQPVVGYTPRGLRHVMMGEHDETL